MSTTVAGPVERNAGLSAEFREKKEVVDVPPVPSEYRKLESGEDYIAKQVADGFEQRTCVRSGSSSLYAAKSFKAGDALSEFGPKVVVTTPNYLTVQVGEESHIMLSPEWLQYINHSCDPNVAFDTTAFKLVALKDIKAGDELVFFYPSTEWKMDAPFSCACGSSVCCGTISGAANMSVEVLSKYRLSDYIAGKLGLNPSTP